jgi:nucleotide-binding universal stress UspA family protein
MKAVQARARIELKNILFATDFSPAADVAAQFALQMAKSYGAMLYGVHVNRIENYTAVAPEAWATMAEAADRECKEDAERLNKQLAAAEHEVIIGEGNTWETLSKVIEQKKIDLIVLGTRGRTGLGKTLLGSVAEEILRRAACPVLTVGPHVSMQPERAAQMREILYATDLAANFPVAAPYAISLAQENEAHLALLHVIEHPKSGELVNGAQTAEAKMRKLQELLPRDADLWCEPRYLVESGIAAEKILDAAEMLRAELIVLGAQPANWLATHFNGGTVHRVVAEAKCPVLTVRG